MSRVRVRFSIIVGYSSLLIRFFSAFLFTILVVRYLSPQEFAVWIFGFSILPIISIGYDLWGWAFARRYALGIRSSLVAATILNIVYMIFSSLTLFFASIYIEDLLGGVYRYLLLFIVNNIFNALVSIAVNLANVLRPDIGLSSTTVFELSRVMIAFVLVRILGTGISGAIVSPALASLISSTFIFYLLSRNNQLIISTKGIIKEIKILLKMSVIGLIDSLARFLWNSDRFFMTLVAKATQAVSYLGVAYSIRGIVAQVSSTPASVVYAKLLEEIRYSPRDVIYMVFLFSSPVLIFSIVLSKPLVSLLNPYYVEMSSVIFLVVIEGFLSGLANVFTGIIYGLERRDLVAKSLRELIETSIGRIQLINFSRALIFGLATFIYSIIIFMKLKLVNVSATQVVVVISLLLLILTLSYISYLTKELSMHRSLEIDFREIIYMLISASISSLIFIATGAWEIEILSITRDTPILFTLSIISLLIYASILYILSRWFRELIHTLLKYLFANLSYNSKI